MKRIYGSKVHVCLCVCFIWLCSALTGSKVLPISINITKLGQLKTTVDVIIVNIFAFMNDDRSLRPKSK